jgi:hypothetical protein
MVGATARSSGRTDTAGAPPLIVDAQAHLSGPDAPGARTTRQDAGHASEMDLASADPAILVWRLERVRAAPNREPLLGRVPLDRPGWRPIFPTT